MRPKRSPRVPRRIRVEFGAGDDKPRLGFTSNLSTTGMFLAANSPYPAGTKVRLKLHLDEPLELDAMVVHARKGAAGVVGAIQSGMGLRFLNAPPQLASILGVTAHPREPEQPAGDARAAAHSERQPAAAGADGGPASAPGARSLAATTPASESEAATAGLERRLAEAENRHQELERLLADDEREKQMLRLLVSKLERSRDELAAELAAATDRAAAGAATKLEETRRKLAEAERDNDRMRQGIGSLELELARLRQAEAEPVTRPERPRTRRIRPLIVPFASAIVLGIAAALLIPRWIATRPVAVVEAQTTRAPTREAPAPGRTAEQGGDHKSAAAAAGAPVARPGAGEDSPSGAGEGPVASVSESPEPAPAAAAPASDEELSAARATIRAWAQAWSEQRVEDYLDFYSVGFEPAGGEPLSEWRRQRQLRVSRPSWIRVTIGDIDLRLLSSDTALATFDQSYETATYRDRTRKTLELVRDDGTWKIEEERSEEP